MQTTSILADQVQLSKLKKGTKRNAWAILAAVIIFCTCLLCYEGLSDWADDVGMYINFAGLEGQK